MHTFELQRIWTEWLKTAERLQRSLYEQTAAITLRDPEKVERLQPDIDMMMARIAELDQNAVACARKLAEDLSVEPSLRSLVRALEKAEAQQVQALANKITVAARNVQHVIKKNQALIENEMIYINGTLTLIAKTATEAQGPYATTAQAAVLVDQAA
jgi:hypothetical protein